jgi:superfamily II DNA or RNA helicase
MLQTIQSPRIKRDKTPNAQLSEANQIRLRNALSAAAKRSHSTRLWAHQRETLAALARHTETRLSRPNAIAVIPTAGGKTEIFAEILQARASLSTPGGKPAFVLTSTLNLVEQTIQRLESTQTFKSVARRWHRRSALRHDLYVMTYARFIRLVQRRKLSEQDIELLILDEAHCGLSRQRWPILKVFDGVCPMLAFSATPAYDLNKSIYALLGQENEVINVSVARLRDDGIIAPAINYVLGVRITGELPRDAAKARTILRTAALDAVHEFQQRHTDPDLNLKMIDRAFIGYHPTRSQAKLASEMYNQSRSDPSGPPSTALAGADPIEAQRMAIASLNNGYLAGIHNALLLVEGTDIPAVSAIYNYFPTNSLVRQVQRCGRAMRLNPRFAHDAPEQLSVIVDVYFEINGTVAGRPRFYFEVVGDEAIAREARSVSRTVDEIEATLGNLRGVKPTSPNSRSGSRKGSGRDNITTIPTAPFKRANLNDWRFTVSSSIDAIRYLIARRDGRISRIENLDAIPCVVRTSQWITRNSLNKRLGRKALSCVSGILDSLPDRFMREVSPETGIATITQGSEKFRLAHIAGRDARGLPTQRRDIVYHTDCIAGLRRIAEQMMPQPVKDDEWLALGEIEKQYGRSNIAETPLKRAWNDLIEAHDSGDQIIVGNAQIHFQLRTQKNAKICYCIHRDSLGQFLEAYQIKRPIPKSDRFWISAGQAVQKIGNIRYKEAVREAFKYFTDALGERSEAVISWHGHDIRIGIRRHNVNVMAHIFHEDFGKLESEIICTNPLIPTGNVDWYSLNRTRSTFKISGRSSGALIRLWKLIDTELRNGRQVLLNSEALRAELRQVGSKNVCTVHRESLPIIAKYLNVDIDTDKLDRHIDQEIEIENRTWLKRDAVAQALPEIPDSTVKDAIKRVNIAVSSAAKSNRTEMVRVEVTGESFTVLTKPSRMMRINLYAAEDIESYRKISISRRKNSNTLQKIVREDLGHWVKVATISKNAFSLNIDKRRMSEALTEAKNLHSDKAEDTVHLRGNNIRFAWISRYKNSKPSYCIHNDDIALFAQVCQSFDNVPATVPKGWMETDKILKSFLTREDHKKAKALFDNFETQIREIGVATNHGVIVTGGIFSNRFKHKVIAFEIESVKRVSNEFGISFEPGGSNIYPLKSAEWLTRTEAYAAIKAGHRRQSFDEIWNELNDAARSGQPYKLGNDTIEYGYRKSPPLAKVLCISINSIDVLRPILIDRHNKSR